MTDDAGADNPLDDALARDMCDEARGPVAALAEAAERFRNARDALLAAALPVAAVVRRWDGLVDVAGVYPFRSAHDDPAVQRWMLARAEELATLIRRAAD